MGKRKCPTITFRQSWDFEHNFIWLDREAWGFPMNQEENQNYESYLMFYKCVGKELNW